MRMQNETTWGEEMKEGWERQGERGGDSRRFVCFCFLLFRIMPPQKNSRCILPPKTGYGAGFGQKWHKGGKGELSKEAEDLWTNEGRWDVSENFHCVSDLFQTKLKGSDQTAT